jgi:hypothetical protein
MNRLIARSSARRKQAVLPWTPGQGLADILLISAYFFLMLLTKYLTLTAAV